MLGWIIAGAAAAYVGKKVYDANHEDSISKFEKESDNWVNYTIKTISQNNRRTHNERNNQRIYNNNQKSRSLDYSKKVDFFDNFREADCNIARYVGKGSGGVGLIILSLKNYYRKHQNEDRTLLHQFINCRNYRIRLSHDRNKWKYIENPSDKLINFSNRIAKWSHNSYEVQKMLKYFPGKIRKDNHRNNWY